MATAALRLVKVVLAVTVVAVVAAGVVFLSNWPDSGRYVDVSNDLGGLTRHELVDRLGEPSAEHYDLLLPNLGVTGVVWQKYPEHNEGERPEKIYLISWKSGDVVTVVWMKNPDGRSLGGLRMQVP